MPKLKAIFTWFLFALCLAAAFGFGYFVRGTVGEDAQTSASAQTTASLSITDTAHTTASAQASISAHSATPTVKPQQTTSTTSLKITAQTTSPADITYILNTSSKKIHYPTCSSAQKILDKNRGTHTGDFTALLSQGYSTCGTCFKK